MGELEGIQIARVATVPMFFATHLKSQIRRLQSEGAVVTVVTSQAPQLAQLRENTELGLELVEMSRALSPISDFRTLVKLITLFRRSDFSVVHSTTPKAGLLCAIAGWLAGVKIRLHTFTGQPWVTLKGPVAFMAKASDRLIGLLNTHCYADSHSQREFLVSQNIISNKKISVLGAGSIAGVDTKRFDPSLYSEAGKSALRNKLGFGPSDFVILFLGRICEDKGIFELLEALESMEADGVAAKLLLVGPIEPASRLGRELTSDAFNALPQVHHVDYTNRPEDFLSIADCLCLPSYREGFGSVVIEAAAMGLPSVGTDIYGLSDAIVDGETGYLVPAREVRPLADALKSLADNPSAASTMGAEARRRAHSEFSSSVIGTAIVAEYARLLK